MHLCTCITENLQALTHTSHALTSSVNKDLLKTGSFSRPTAYLPRNELSAVSNASFVECHCADDEYFNIENIFILHRVHEIEFNNDLSFKSITFIFSVMKTINSRCSCVVYVVIENSDFFRMISRTGYKLAASTKRKNILC